QAAFPVLPGAELGAALLPGAGAELSDCVVLGAGDNLLPAGLPAAVPHADCCGVPGWELRSAGCFRHAGCFATARCVGPAGCFGTAGRFRTASDAATGRQYLSE